MLITVLLADGDEHARKFIEGLIRTFFKEKQRNVVVIGAKSGHEAQSALSNTPEGSIDAVVTCFDFGGGITGLELIAWLKQSHPNIPVLLMSSCNLEGHEGQADEFLQKPLADIRAVGEALGRLLAKIKQPAH